MIATTSPAARVKAHLTAVGAEALTRCKPAYFERRMRSRWRACGVTALEAYADRLDQDPAERGRLAAALTINVTGFFRNPGTWSALGKQLTWGVRPLRAWSAGCATGEEAWSLAALCWSQRPDTAVWRVDATDLDTDSLATAAHGRYPLAARDAIEALVPDAPLEAEGAAVVMPRSWRKAVHFRQADLTQPAPATGYDVVLCRNVLIYFADEAQEQMLTGLIDALRPGGLLVLGKAELAAWTVAPRLETVDRRERIYRRIG